MRDQKRFCKNSYRSRCECQSAQDQTAQPVSYPFTDVEHARRCLCANTNRLTGDIVRKLWFSFAIPIAGGRGGGRGEGGGSSSELIARATELFEEASAVCVETPSSATLFSTAAPSCIRRVFSRRAVPDWPDRSQCDPRYTKALCTKRSPNLELPCELRSDRRAGRV